MMPACTGPTGSGAGFRLPSQKIIPGVRHRRLAARAKRMPHAPKAEVEPGPRVGQSHRIEPEEIADRALKADRRRCSAPTDGNFPCRHCKVATTISPARSSSTAMCAAPVSPQRPSSVQYRPNLARDEPPAVPIYDHARPRTMPGDSRAFNDIVSEAWVFTLSQQLATFGTRRSAQAEYRSLRRTPARDVRTSECRMPSPRRSTAARQRRCR